MYSFFLFNILCVKSTVMIDYYPFFHICSFTENNIGPEGCEALVAVLHEYKELQVLK